MQSLGGDTCMSDVTTVTDAGIVSLSGFAYQIKVFVMLASRLQKNQRVEFETLDDVTVNSLPSNDNQDDSCIKKQFDGTSGVKVFQVKQTNVTNDVCRKVLYNWLLALNEERNISEFILYIEKGYSEVTSALSNTAAKEYKKIVDSDRLPTALVSRVKALYQSNPQQFSKDYEYICSHWRSERLENIDEIISSILTPVFHADASSIGPIYYQKRIEELFNKICSRIMECASKRKPYICMQNEYMQLCDEICRNISPDRYAPDYASFNRVHTPLQMSSEIAQSREYRQLEFCKLTLQDILSHLSWEQYYQNIRQHYFSDAQKDWIAETEGVAYQNHLNVVGELNAEGRDSPILRLLRTKQQTINTLPEEYSRWGSYIYLTNDDATNKISWKEENNDGEDK